MASLELVNAVQRTLEKEGVLSDIRATLRASVLKALSRTKDSDSNSYNNSKKDNIKAFIKRNECKLAIDVVRDLMVVLGLKESLCVFDAETGITTTITTSTTTTTTIITATTTAAITAITNTITTNITTITTNNDNTTRNNIV